MAPSAPKPGFCIQTQPRGSFLKALAALGAPCPAARGMQAARPRGAAAQGLLSVSTGSFVAAGWAPETWPSTPHEQQIPLTLTKPSASRSGLEVSPEQTPGLQVG